MEAYALSYPALLPDLCGDEKLLPGRSALGDGVSDALLVAVCLGSVYAAVSVLYRFKYAAFCFLRRCLVYSVAELRHFHAVI